MIKTTLCIIGAAGIIITGLFIANYISNKQINDANMKCIELNKNFIHTPNGWLCNN